MMTVKILSAFALALAFASLASAQDDSAPAPAAVPAVASLEAASASNDPDSRASTPAQSLSRHAWELGVFSGGGLGLGKSDTTQFLYAGGRVGWVLTGDHLHGWMRGNFEWAVDLMPLYTVFPPNSAVYGGSFKPAIWQWNFTSGKKIVAYVAAAGGIVFSRDNIPPGDTSTVNFTSQLVTGARIFLKPGRALFFEDAVGHFSSASLGNHNPGYNAFLEFTVGYSWCKSPH
jgi:lipid A 3-O-deacylase